jgi:glycosyltransferase involved in cell wall biosynthesis
MSVIIVQCISKLELGGAQKRVIELMRELGDKGILISGEGGELYCEVKREFENRHITLPCLKREVKPFYDIICLFKLRKLLIELYRDSNRIILHTHGSKAGVIGRLVSGTLPFVHSVHTVHGFAISPYVNVFKRFIYLNAERISALFGDIIITQAKLHIDKLREWRIGGRNKLFWLANSIKYSDYGFHSRRYKKKEIVVGTVANFKPQKNPFMWAEVAKKIVERYPEVNFIYVGDGPLKKKTEELIGANERIKLLSWKENIPQILRKIDVFFLPSRWEGLPRTVLEAMASGVPVVASSVDGTTEAVLDFVTGYLLPPDDLNGYIEKLSELIQDENKRKTMGIEGRKRVKKYFSYKKMIKKIFYIYKSLGLTYRGKAAKKNKRFTTEDTEE